MTEDLLTRARELAVYIIETRTTIRQAAKHFGLSKSTVHKDLAERLPAANPKHHIMFSAFVNDKSLAAWSLCNVQWASTDHDLNSDTEHCFRYAIHLNPPVGFNGTWE